MPISITDAIQVFLILLASLSVHEWAHAWTAEKLGDSTSRMLGRVTLNPISHIDPIGTIIVPAFMLFSGSGLFFAWAKPVPVNSSNFRKPKRDDILVTMAGPASNLLIALATVVLFGLIARISGTTHLYSLGVNVIQINVLLMLFNLIPVPPLDGSHVMRHLTGMSYETYIKLSQFGIFILLALLFFTPLGEIFRYCVSVVTLNLSLIMSLIGGQEVTIQ